MIGLLSYHRNSNSGIGAVQFCAPLLPCPVIFCTEVPSQMADIGDIGQEFILSREKNKFEFSLGGTLAPSCPNLDLPSERQRQVILFNQQSAIHFLINSLRKSYNSSLGWTCDPYLYWVYTLACGSGANPNPWNLTQGQVSHSQKRGIVVRSRHLQITNTNSHTSLIMSSSPVHRNRYKLESEFGENVVTHRTFKTDLRTRQRRIEVRTTWTRERILGAGAFGEVRLESEHATGELRAVKAISKTQVNISEVEALIELQDVSKKGLRQLCDSVSICDG